MERMPIVSNHLSSVGYNEATGKMEIEFRVGRVYEYGSVPPEVYDALIRAPSAGTFFHRCIRGNYPEVEVTHKEQPNA